MLLNENERQAIIDTLQKYHEENGCSPKTGILSKITGFPLKDIMYTFSGLEKLYKSAEIPTPCCWCC